jgi:hypothetical protein
LNSRKWSKKLAWLRRNIVEEWGLPIEKSIKSEYDDLR